MPSVYEIVTERMIEMLSKGVIPWRQPWTQQSHRGPISLATGKPYRGMNRWLLDPATNGFTDPRYATFKQIAAKGGTVNAGEKSRLCVFWTFFDDKKNVGKKIPMLRYYRVFNVQQTSGMNVKPWDNGIVAGKVFDPIPACEKIIAGWKNPAKIVEGAAQCSYNTSTDIIGMVDKSAFCAANEWYSTLFHEMIHATGHPTRLHRDMSGNMRTEKYAREELIAEMGAAMLGCMVGIDNTKVIENNAAYLQSWIAALNGDSRLVVTAAGAAQKAVDSIIGKSEEEETSEEE